MSLSSFSIVNLAETDTGLWDSCQPTTSQPLLLSHPSECRRCAISRESDSVFSRARWQRGDGSNIIRLKFQRYLRRSIFFQRPRAAFQDAAPLTTGLISGVWRENPSFPSRLCLSSLAKQKKSGSTGPTSTTNKCANKRDFREGYFDVECICDSIVNCRKHDCSILHDN